MKRNPDKSPFSLRCAACGRAISYASVVRRPSGVGHMHVCELCDLRLRGSFFAPGPVSQVTRCLLGHPIRREDSPRVGWVRCATCQAAMTDAWACLAAGDKLPQDAGVVPSAPTRLAASGQYLLF